jgi:hypothetical protein
MRRCHKVQATPDVQDPANNNHLDDLCDCPFIAHIRVSFTKAQNYEGLVTFEDEGSCNP